MKKFRIAHEGIYLVLLITFFTVTVWIVTLLTNSTILFWSSVLLTMVNATILFLFRDPHRVNHDLSDLDIVSPTDGKIINLGPAEESEFLKKPAIRLSIFLSLPDVHVNWAPVGGVVMHKKSSDGHFFPAFTERAGEKNKRVSIGIECADGFRMTVVQITGFVARRIKCHLTPGQEVKRGDRYGMIFFGSRVDVFVPSETKITVRKGDRVKGGVTVIGQKNIPNDKNKNTAA